jgi:hypothetical protein
MVERILITGSRDWSDADLLRRVVLRMLAVSTQDAVLVHGGCRGVDVDAARLWREAGRPVEVHAAEWDVHGRAAGPIRNQLMVDLGADMCVALIRDGSRGASQCADAAERAGIQTYRILS